MYFEEGKRKAEERRRVSSAVPHPPSPSPAPARNGSEPTGPFGSKEFKPENLVDREALRRASAEAPG